MLVITTSRIRIHTAIPTYCNRWGGEMNVLAISFCLAYKMGLGGRKNKTSKMQSSWVIATVHLFTLGRNV